MIVAYDLRFASDHFAGIGTHAYALLDALLTRPGDERYLVLWNPDARDTRHDLDRIATHPRVRWLERRWAPLDPIDPFRLGGWLRAERPTLFLSPFYFVPVLAGCPVVITIHDVWPMRMSEGLGRVKHLLYRIAMARARRAAAILTSSRFSRDEIVSCIRAPADRVHAILLGRALHRLHVEAVAPSPAPDRPYALVVGDNRPRKNLATLARAWAALGPEPPLELLGAGPIDDRHPTLETLAGQHGARRVRTLGWVGEDELEWLYEHAALMLFPSRYEGFGFPLVEALGHGLPVIAADTATFREVGGDVARYVAADDVEGWARAVRDHVTRGVEGKADEALRARRRAATMDYAITAAGTLDVLRRLSNTRRGTAAPGRDA